MELLTGLVGVVAPAFAGLVGYLHKRHTTRLDGFETSIEEHRRSLDTKLNRADVKELVDDKLAPIIVTLLDIKKDCEEIGKDVKALYNRHI